MKPYSFNLRQKIVEYTNGEGSLPQLALRFRVNLSIVKRRIKKFGEKIQNIGVKLLQQKYLPSLQEKLRLREINLVMFPDWSQSEECLGWELQ